MRPNLLTVIGVVILVITCGSDAQQPEGIEFPKEEAPSLQSRAAVCITKSGQRGLCRPLVKCVTFYAEIPELRRQPCELGPQQLGVCCPLSKRPAEQLVPQEFGPPRPNTGILNVPPPPPIVIPPLTQHNLDTAAQTAEVKVAERNQLEESLAANDIVVQEGTAAALHQDFFKTTADTLETGSSAVKSNEAAIDLLNKFQLTPEQGTFALPRFSILNTTLADACPKRINCPQTKYRSVDGSCNNLQRQNWGKANTALQRILPPKYGDGVSSPRVADNRQPLPSARLISTALSTNAGPTYDNYTLLVMQWGQFLDHDLTHTPIVKGKDESGVTCCQDGREIERQLRHPDCFAIEIPANDRIFGRFQQRCMEFVRSLPAPRPECNFGPREQMNQITAFLDGSNVYGSGTNTARSLRSFRGGQLKAQPVTESRGLLPANPSECQQDATNNSCFSAGDVRVNEQVQLTVMHTVWMREHNRIAQELAQLNPFWPDEILYQEARRIVIAEMQHITFNEYLPLVLGHQYMTKFNLLPRDGNHTELYDAELNPGITNVFAAAAYRYGHSLIQGHMEGFTRFGGLNRNLVLHKHQFSPFVLYEPGALDSFIRGLSTQACQKMDRFFSSDLTDHLFQGELPFGLDLVALNIQRGRDHGLPPYNDWRQVCGLPEVKRWEDLLDTMDEETVRTLSRVYSSPTEIDVFIGGVSEKPVPGALLGPTFVCLVGDQFARVRRGDRFFYEEGNQPHSFTPEQLVQLNKVSLARVLCDNSDGLAVVQPLVFFQASLLNMRVSCFSEAVPRVDLSPWRGERV